MKGLTEYISDDSEEATSFEFQILPCKYHVMKRNNLHAFDFMNNHITHFSVFLAFYVSITITMGRLGM